MLVSGRVIPGRVLLWYLPGVTSSRLVSFTAQGCATTLASLSQLGGRLPATGGSPGSWEVVGSEKKQLRGGSQESSNEPPFF